MGTRNRTELMLRKSEGIGSDIQYKLCQE